METEQMILIYEEITAGNARIFVKSSISRAHFSKLYTQQWYTVERAHTNWMREYQQRVDAVTTEKTRVLHTLRLKARLNATT